jgi:hypothetical protein
MIALENPREWVETAANAMNAWPAAQLAELLSWLWTRNEPSLRLLADAMEQPATPRAGRWS